MTYSVKEIYYTLQGEGANCGRPAVFLRFAGCNLWSGRLSDRHKGPGGCSNWCDTDFVGIDGPGGGKFSSAGELVDAVLEKWPVARSSESRPFVVCTGGEPLLQLDSELLGEFSKQGADVAAETNGTIAAPDGLFWVTVSPKANAPLRITRGQELKFVYPQPGLEPEEFENLDFERFYLQPLDNGEQKQNVARALEYCLRRPKWRLSLQTHKLIGIP
jgi:7-carboxy-7-deazaguanine synthase